MCKSTQTPGEQTDQFPPLPAPVDSHIILRYQENGHIALPWNQVGKLTSGTVSVYAASQPNPNDMFMAIHNVSTSDRSGRDGRGCLVANKPFDDGKCHQLNGRSNWPRPMPDPLQGINLWCATNVTLNDEIQQPLPAGSTITLYWVWDWPTAPGIDQNLPDGKNEAYTMCMDVIVT